MKYKIKNQNSEMFDLDIVENLIYAEQKIGLIKELRRISGMGLKDSKDAIELGYQYNGAGTKSDIDKEKIINTFKAYLVVDPEPYTKEEFMNNIEEAIDGMDKMQFTDMIEVVELLCKNITKNGGLVALAQKRDEFLNSI